MYTVIDFETNGLSPVENQVIEIGAVKLDADLKPVQTFHTMVRLSRGQELSDFIKNYTGITEEDLKDGEYELNALLYLRKFIGGDTVIAQYASFDLSFLQDFIHPEFICTRSMSQLLWPKEKSGLADLVERFEIQLENHHRALDDALATAEAFKYLKHLCEAEGIEYKNVMTERVDRPLNYIPVNARVKQLG